MMEPYQSNTFRVFLLLSEWDLFTNIKPAPNEIKVAQAYGKASRIKSCLDTDVKAISPQIKMERQEIVADIQNKTW